MGQGAFVWLTARLSDRRWDSTVSRARTVLPLPHDDRQFSESRHQIRLASAASPSRERGEKASVILRHASETARASRSETHRATVCEGRTHRRRCEHLLGVLEGHAITPSVPIGPTSSGKLLRPGESGVSGVPDVPDAPGRFARLPRSPLAGREPRAATDTRATISDKTRNLEVGPMSRSITAADGAHRTDDGLRAVRQGDAAGRGGAAGDLRAGQRLRGPVPRVLLASPTGQPVGTTAFTRLCADIPVADAPNCIDTLLVPGGVPADFTFSPGTHDIPEELTPDTVPDALAAVRELAPRASRIASVCTGIRACRAGSAGWASCDHPLGTLHGARPGIPPRHGGPRRTVRAGRPLHHRSRDQCGHRPGPGHRRERLRHGRRPPGSPDGWSSSCNVRAARPSSASGPRRACPPPGSAPG